MKRQSGWKTKGMNRDISVSAFNPEFAFENMNLRLSTNDGNTLMSWVNEKGTAPLAMMQGKPGRGAALVPARLPGTAIGTAVLNNYLVIFLTNREGDKPDAICRFNYPAGCTYLEVELLYEGNLGFSTENPIETLVSYEAEDIQKVYWVDGKNQPRIINIVADDTNRSKYSDTYFDFIPTLQLKEKVHVRKVLGGGGTFAPGVIQYAFTYYHKYGQESNIFYTTPLLYISHRDRGAAPDDKVDNAFRITVENPDTNFEFLRIYSIQRTNINATPICKRVQDIDLRGEIINNSISYIDAGNSGDSIDPMELLYKGGWSTAVGTMEQKDQTLFMGSFSTEDVDLTDIISSDDVTASSSGNEGAYTRNIYPTVISKKGYGYASQLTAFNENGDSVPCGGFKWGNYYRCGVQFQDIYGRWTHPLFIQDVPVEGTPSADEIEETKSEFHKTLPGVWEDYYSRTDNVPYDRIPISGTGVLKDVYVTIKLINNSDRQITYNGTFVFILYGSIPGYTGRVILKGRVNGKITGGDGTTGVLDVGEAATLAVDFTHNNFQDPGTAEREGLKFAHQQQRDPYASNVGYYNDGICYTCQALDSDRIFRGGDVYNLIVESAVQKMAEVEEVSPSGTRPDGGGSGYDGTGNSTEYSDSSSLNGIQFVFHNNTDTTIPYSGKLKFYVTRSASTNWNAVESQELEAHFNGPTYIGDGYPHWWTNPNSIAPGGTATVTLTQVTKYVGTGQANIVNTIYESLDKYYNGYSFMSSDHPNYFAIKIGYAVKKSDGSIGDNSSLIHAKPIAANIARITKGRTYHLIIDYVNTSSQYWNSLGRSLRGISLRSISSEETENGTGKVTLPVLKGSITSSTAIERLCEKGFRKARAVVVFPTIQDRIKLCQGVANPTLYTDNHRGYTPEGSQDKIQYLSNRITRDLYAQSSWFFRAPCEMDDTTGEYKFNATVNSPNYLNNEPIGYYNCNSHLNLSNGDEVEDLSPKYLRRTEIQGLFDKANQFKIDWNTLTFHSPDVEFDTNLRVFDYGNSSICFKVVGEALFKNTLSDIDIQVETPAISNSGSGFDKKSFTGNNTQGIISGLFYDDFLVDDDSSSDTGFRKYRHEKQPARFMVYLWNRTGSLNNDISRPANRGVQSALLKRKIISNLRYADCTIGKYDDLLSSEKTPIQLFDSEEISMLKLETGEAAERSNVYSGNIDTLLLPDHPDGQYFAYNSLKSSTFVSDIRYKTCSLDGEDFQKEDDSNQNQRGIWRYDNNWYYSDKTINASDGFSVYEFLINTIEGAFFKSIGDDYNDLVLKKDSIRMKYKSSPHLVITKAGASLPAKNTLNILELERSFSSSEETGSFIQNVMFGGMSEDALRENVWLPCGEPVDLTNKNGGPLSSVEFEYSYGDTYYQRWDCLKTYAFTPDDINQVVEIGSFMLETYTNIDGRYDRNRGQMSNLYMSPRNFNLLNPVYSQQDNFFQYRIVDKDKLGEKKYENQVIWSKTKTSGADVDLWTNVTLSSPLELDGDKGPINKLARFNDQLIAFQDRGTAQILYNENVQISTEQGVPVELANSGKVQGKRYISDSIGCVNKWSVCTTPSGIYFMDSIDRNIYLFNGQFNNLSNSLGMNSWVKGKIPPTLIKWTPYQYVSDGTTMDGFDNFVTYNDRQNQEVLFINKETALAYSEKLAVFTSFYDYGHTPYFCNFVDGGIWIRNEENGDNNPITSLHGHQQGEYCSFFGEHKPYWMTLVSNPDPQLDKVFTNLEFRACVEGDGELDDETGKFTPTLPFDVLETWNEYQRGIAHLTHRNGHSAMLHHTTDNIGSLKRKFRIWRCDVPRDNGDNISVFDNSFNDTFLAPSRRKHPNDRMRNPWLYVRLAKEASEHEALKRTEIHDILMTYFA